MKIEYFVPLDDTSKKYLQEYINALCLFSISTDKSSLDAVESVGITASLNPYSCDRNLVFCISDSVIPPQAESLSNFLRNLHYAASNPILPFDANLFVILPDCEAAGQLRSFCTASKSNYRMANECSNVLSVFPWLTTHDRTGHGIKIKITQDILKLYQMSSTNSYSAPKTGLNDVLSCIKSVVFGAYERKLLPQSLQGHTSIFDPFIKEHKLEDIRDFLCGLQQIDTTKNIDLIQKITDIDVSILNMTFGRLFGGKLLTCNDWQTHGLDDVSKTKGDCILFMTEQTSLFDVLYAMKKYTKLYLMYSPLIIMHRFLAESVLSSFSSGCSSMECTVDYMFYPAHAPIVLEAILKQIRKNDGNPLYIVGGGTETTYLVLLKLTQVDKNMKLMSSVSYI